MYAYSYAPLYPAVPPSMLRFQNDRYGGYAEAYEAAHTPTNRDNCKLFVVLLAPHRRSPLLPVLFILSCRFERAS